MVLVKFLVLPLLLVSAFSANAEQFYAYEEVADTVASATALPPLLQQHIDEQAQLKLEYHSGQIVAQLESSASLPRLLQRLLFLQALSDQHPAVGEFLQREVFALAHARWESFTATTTQQQKNIDFLRSNPFVFTALSQLPRAYTHVNTVLPLASPPSAAFAVFDSERAVRVLLTIEEPLVLFSSIALLRRVLSYYDYQLDALDELLAQHGQRLLQQSQTLQATLLAFVGGTGWQVGLKRLLREQRFFVRALPLALTLYLGYVVTEKVLEKTRWKWKQTAHYSDQIVLYLLQAS